MQLAVSDSCTALQGADSYVYSSDLCTITVCRRPVANLEVYESIRDRRTVRENARSPTSLNRIGTCNGVTKRMQYFEQQSKDLDCERSVGSVDLQLYKVKP